MASLSPLILKTSHLIQAICLRVSDLFFDRALSSAVVTFFFEVSCLGPLAILKSRFSKSEIGPPVMDAEVMRSSILLAFSNFTSALGNTVK